jgi:hypothetical protein
MTDARVEPVYEDRVRAREFLAQSERFFTDANRSGLAAESRSVLFHNAAVCACDAILQAAGLRVLSATVPMCSGSRRRSLRFRVIQKNCSIVSTPPASGGMMLRMRRSSWLKRASRMLMRQRLN